MLIWQTSRFQLDLSRPLIMGIVNVTPDSFSDNGHHLFTSERGLPAVLERCEQLIKDGADILDIGGESSRPGAMPLPLEAELSRILPVVSCVVSLGVPISVDTYKPEVMRAVLDLGADIINDIWALRQTGAMEVVAHHPACGVCLMHMHREPQTMQAAPMDGEVMAQVLTFLKERAGALEAAGVDRSRIVLDPGIGFGKTVEQNFLLLRSQRELLRAGYPLLAGWSRKSSLAIASSGASIAGMNLNMADRLVPSVAAALLAVDKGARVVRVHDVRETAQALRIWAAAS